VELFNGKVPSSLIIKLVCYASSGLVFLPVELEQEVKFEGGKNGSANAILRSSLNVQAPLSSCGGEEGNKASGWFTIFLLGMAGGFLALLAPCVFPMVPVTLSYFTNRARSNAYKDGLLYGSCIFLIYLFASVPFHLAGNISPHLFNTIATNAWINLAFFVVFLGLALSFFGLFDIRLPSGCPASPPRRMPT
jgi:thiol:disulfide interchange protein